mmetsp:Transcript_23971/g.66547  ORF Transcript_23971/g.66547 Transcript_23971/m.66547 type:complete len:80 (+) Transcript_23971:76-315(+)
MNDSWWRRLKRSIGNSVTARLTIDLLDHHMEYRSKIHQLRDLLQAFHLNDLYADFNLTGFSINYNDLELPDERGPFSSS